MSVRVVRVVRVVLVALAALAVLSPTTGCGVKDAPRPAEDTAPLAPDDFIARNVEGGVRLKWQRPGESVDGEPLDDLAGFEVERRRPQERRFEVIHRIRTADTDRIRPHQTFHYTDQTPPAGVLEYRVRAYLGDGHRGLPSRIAVVDTTAPPAKD